MKESRSNFAYLRTLKLGPALWDWTSIQHNPSDVTESQIFPIQHINFDSLPKERMKYVHYLHYRLAEKWVAQLSTDMDIKIELHMLTASQLSYQDFLTSLPASLFQAQFNIESIGKIQAILDWGLADRMVDRLTGGKGEESQTAHFSDIEKDILHAQMEQLIPSFITSWKSIFRMDQIHMDCVCGAYSRDKKLSHRDAIMVFSAHLGFGGSELQKISWIYPADVLRKCLQKRSVLVDPIKKRVSFQSKTLRNLKVDVATTLGKTTLTMTELKQLQVGDIIPLDTTLESPLDVTIGDKAKFFGQAGTINKRMCIQLIFMDADDMVSLADPPQTYMDLPAEITTQEEEVEAPVDEEEGISSEQSDDVWDTDEPESDQNLFDKDGDDDHDDDEAQEEEEEPENKHPISVGEESEDDFSWDNLDEDLSLL